MADSVLHHRGPVPHRGSAVCDVGQGGGAEVVDRGDSTGAATEGAESPGGGGQRLWYRGKHGQGRGGVLTL